MDLTYDVVVIGGGSAGISAAVSSAQNGAKTLLVEREASLGGQAISAKVASYCGFYTRGKSPDLAVGGVGQEILNRMEKAGIDTSPHPSIATGNSSIKFDAEKMKIIFDQLIQDSDADFLYHTSLIGINVQNNHIISVKLSDDEEQYNVFAKSFIDATGNGNLFHLAGLKTDWGDQDGNVQQASLVMTLGNLPKRVISLDEIKHALIQAKADGITPLPIKQGMIFKRKEATSGMCLLPSTQVSSLKGSELTKQEIYLRQQSQAIMQVINHYIKDCENVQLVETGPNMGLREARRMHGDETLLGIDILKAKKRPDSIGRAAWSPELHRNGDFEYHYIPDNDYASIPLGILHSCDLTNLWGGGRLVSSDSTGLGSLRVMGTSFVTGQAAGVAASQQALTNTVELVKVQSILRAQGALL